MASIVPAVKSIYLCDKIVGAANGKVDLQGVFSTIRPPRGYPHAQGRITVFAQLANGLGEVATRVEICRAGTRELIRPTEPKVIAFPTRTTLIKYVFTIEQCRFDEPGVYLVELYCNNEWVGDTTLDLLNPDGTRP